MLKIPRGNAVRQSDSDTSDPDEPPAEQTRFLEADRSSRLRVTLCNRPLLHPSLLTHQNSCLKPEICLSLLHVRIRAGGGHFTDSHTGP